jgi:hypothetical protein
MTTYNANTDFAGTLALLVRAWGSSAALAAHGWLARVWGVLTSQAVNIRPVLGQIWPRITRE